MRVLPHSAVLSRRAMLRAIGLTAGAIAAAPVLASLLPNRPLKLGVLLPRSQAYPTLSENLLAGMRLHFDQIREQGGRAIELVAESTGLGAGGTIAKSQQLVGWQRVDLLVAIVGAYAAKLLGKLSREKQTPLIVANAGARVPSHDNPNPYVFHNSLNLWQASRALGAWAATHLGRRAFVAKSFYDSGHDIAYAFQAGFEQAGGRVLETSLTHHPHQSDDLTATFDAIRQNQPDFVFGCYCGQWATDFVQAYTASGLSRSVPLIGSGFIADESLLPAQGRAALGIKTALAWSSDLDSDDNRAFSEAYQRLTGRPADAFAVLGFDTGQLITASLPAVDGNTDRTEAWLNALSTAEVASPRGQLAMNAQTHSSVGPVYVREVQRRDGKLVNAALGPLSLLSPLDEPIVAVRSKQQSGWSNPYLCV
ncbi:MAG TPA: ABC transporter substrate-binding protein [Anaerolineae bacterium]|nr:ABC transporter substrate-binding protein [Anaerolineae bacterium]